MKKFINISVILTLVFSAVFLSACAQDASANVKSYNNSIVQIQKNMLSQASQESRVFTQPNLNPALVTQALQQIRQGIMASYLSFKAINVPPGAQDLAASMERFFNVENSGIQDVIYGVMNIQMYHSDPIAVRNFNNVFNQFSNQENSALRDFYTTQQMVAAKYSQKVVDTGN